MRGASRESLAAVVDRFEGLLDTVPAAADRVRLGEDLFSVATLLDATPALRRALTDPSRAGQDKADLATRLLAGRVGRDTQDLVAGAVRERWTRTRDLADALERSGVAAVLAAAEAGDRLDTVEDELFRLQRIVMGDRELRRALTEQRAPASAKELLVDRLLERRGEAETAVLARRLASRPRGRTPEQAFDDVLEAAAERRQRLIAHVTVAVPMTEGQRTRLAAALSARYGRTIRLAVDTDPAVIGGVRVHVGDEVFDGTLSRRLAAAAELMTR
ncbi:MAG: F0F1 ATP synthase subunit delta [Kineosporiaceae bacterium]